MGFLVLEKLKLTFDSFSFVHHFLTKKIFFHYRFVGYQFIDFHYDLREREKNVQKLFFCFDIYVFGVDFDAVISSLNMDDEKKQRPTRRKQKSV